jgi:hypothetical protein
VHRTLNTNKIVKYNNYLHKAGRSWISEIQNQRESSSVLQLPEKQTTPRGLKRDPPGRLSGDFRIHKLEINVCWSGGKQDISCNARQCKVCAAHKK